MKKPLAKTKPKVSINAAGTRRLESPPSGPHVAAYVRVSSKSQSGTMQRDAIHAATKARGEAILTPFWYEETRSGDSHDRPALAQLRADVRAGKVSKLYVYKLDRLSRDGIRDSLILLDEFEKHGATVVTLDDGFDLQTKGPLREFQAAIFAWFAASELETIRDRRKAARESAQRRGVKWGRPAREIPAHKLVRARKMLARGEAERTIAMALKVSRSRLRRALGPELAAMRAKLAAKRGSKVTPLNGVTPSSKKKRRADGHPSAVQ